MPAATISHVRSSEEKAVSSAILKKNNNSHETEAYDYIIVHKYYSSSGYFNQGCVLLGQSY